jgi:hypothetical protein
MRPTLALAVVIVAVIYLLSVYRKNGLNGSQRVQRTIHAVGLTVTVLAVAVGISRPGIPAQVTVLVVAALWLLAAITGGVLRYMEQVRARRVDAGLGQPFNPKPMAIEDMVLPWLVYSFLFAIPALLGTFAGVALIAPDVFSKATHAQGASAVVFAPVGVAMGLALLVVVARKLARNAAIRYHDELVKSFAALLRAERSVGYDSGYSDAQHGRPKHQPDPGQ